MVRAVVVAVVLVVVGTVGWARWWHDHERDDACAVVRASVARRGDRPVGTGPRQVLVVGDSYAQGWGLRDPRGSWPTAMADEADATVRVDGFAGSGFTGSAFCAGEDFGARAARLDLTDDEVLVVQGGLNDVNADPDVIEAAAVAVLEAAGADAVVGPPPAPQRDQALTVATDEALARAAEDAGVVYVSTIDWDDLTYLPDRLHLTPKGHAVFGTRVADALLEAGVLR